VPQPAEIPLLEDPLASAYVRAHQRILAEQEAIAEDPLKLARAQHLAEARARIEAISDDLDDEAADWVQTQYPKVYGMGVADGAAEVGASPVWGQVHQQAVQQLSQSLFDDLLSATKGVRDSTKKLVRTIAKDEALQAAIEGRTARQAAAEMRRLLESNAIHAIRYANGAKHGLAEYTQMAMRTKTAQAYNIGTLNGAPDVKWFEVFDGPSCGWSEHSSGEIALGMIVSKEEAMSYPISHPNCRRSFGARPDLNELTKQGVKDLGADNPLTVGAGQTTIGQRAAQLFQDQGTLLRQQRVAARQAKLATKDATVAKKAAKLEARAQKLGTRA
jgi:hypothetical protein